LVQQTNMRGAHFKFGHVEIGKPSFIILFYALIPNWIVVFIGKTVSTN
jgi:hypothetical protein